MEVLYVVFWVVFLLYIWFETDALVSYLKLFFGNKITYYFALNKHKERQKESLEPLDYLDFLRVEYPDSFCISLITCPSCLGVWLTAILCLLMGDIYHFPVVYIFSMLVYLLLRKLIRL